MESRKGVLSSTIRLVIKNYSKHEVGKNAAALSYYFLFMIFPLVIFISNLLGLVDVNVGVTKEQLDAFLPQDIVNLLEAYLEHVSNNSSFKLLWFSLVFSIWFPMRAAKAIMDCVRAAYHLEQPEDKKKYLLRRLVFTLLLLVAVVLCLLLTVIGKNIVTFILSVTPDNLNPVMGMFPTIWQYFRFVLIGMLMYGVLSGVYRLALDDWRKRGTMLPGVMTAMTVWMVASVVFSVYVEKWANYSLTYGALGAVVVLLLWLYIGALSIIIGIEFNAAFEEVRGKEFQIREELEKLELKEKITKIAMDIPALFLAIKDKETPIVAKVLACVTVGYALSPIDILPDFMFGLGYLDELILLPLLIRFTLKYIPKDVFERCQEASYGMWENGKPKKWYYALPVVAVWCLVILVIYKIIR